MLKYYHLDNCSRNRLPQNSFEINAKSQWASPYQIRYWEGDWFVYDSRSRRGELAPDMDAAIARMLELYKAYCREMIWLNPDWIAPLKDCDYLCDCWFSGGPARVLCEVINENKPG